MPLMRGRFKLWARAASYEYRATRRTSLRKLNVFALYCGIRISVPMSFEHGRTGNAYISGVLMDRYPKPRIQHHELCTDPSGGLESQGSMLLLAIELPASQ
jgi:hypothetical protein